MDDLDRAAAGLLDEINFGSARGGKRPSEVVSISVLRSLGEDDLPALRSPPPVAAPPPSLTQIRHSHHHLARLLAEGIPQVKIGLILGYSQSYISNIQRDPAFGELVEYYRSNRELVFADVDARMRALGLDTLEELQRRLEFGGDKFANRELMELAELMLLRGRQGPGGAPAGSGGGPTGGSGVNIRVQFVQAAHGDIAGAGSGPLVDVTPEGGVVDD